MSDPISPPPALGGGRNELPAYLSNGVLGLRVRETPLSAGIALVSGYTGEHPIRRIEAAALAPYPVAGDIQIDGVRLSDVPHQMIVVSQEYNFTCAELTSWFEFRVGDVRGAVEVLTFCDRVEPTIVCQEVLLEVSGACDVEVRAIIDAGSIDGRALRHLRDTPGEAEPACDGALLWESAGGLSTCGIAYATELIGADDATLDRPPLASFRLYTGHAFRAEQGRQYKLRQLTSMVPSQLHGQPDQQAVRLVALARRHGFDAIRSGNRAAWADLWKGRIHLIGAHKRWQGLADAALFYLISSTHTASPASTSIFGLATWRDYHYYFGHVMWDIETFVSPVLSFLQPGAAESVLDYRSRNISSAASNARLRGRRGLQFPWESTPSTGQECAPMPGSASWHEDHVSLDIARAFAIHAYISGDREFLRQQTWPVLSGVAKWIESRVVRTDRGFEIRSAMGIAERKQESNNAAFTNMSAVTVLRDAIAAANVLSLPASPAWADIADNLVLPKQGDIVVSHDSFEAAEEKGSTPDPLMGVFPLGFPFGSAVEAATLKFYLGMAEGYVGSPMLSALYGVWAAYAGDRDLSARLLEDGYGRFCVDRFEQALEYREDVFPNNLVLDPSSPISAGFLWDF